jgi:hypothetical protein
MTISSTAVYVTDGIVLFIALFRVSNNAASL